MGLRRTEGKPSILGTKRFALQLSLLLLLLYTQNPLLVVHLGRLVGVCVDILIALLFLVGIGCHRQWEEKKEEEVPAEEGVWLEISHQHAISFLGCGW